MICDRCQKHEATIEIREVIGSSNKTVHLCMECAMSDGMLQANGITVDLTSILCNLTSKVMGGDASRSAEHTEGTPELTCGACGTTDIDVRHTGRLGCPDCYDTFADLIRSALAGMHKGTRHVPGAATGGRRADAGAVEECELTALREELALAVASEAYEHAAKLRDQIDARARSPEGSQ